MHLFRYLAGVLGSIHHKALPNRKTGMCIHTLSPDSVLSKTVDNEAIVSVDS
jgi:hypothetical protein